MQHYLCISLTLVCSKILEHIIHSSIMTHLDGHNILQMVIRISFQTLSGTLIAMYSAWLYYYKSK